MATNRKQVLKRLLSLTLIVVLCLQLFPFPAQASSEAVLTNGMPVTEENVLALIEEYRNGKEPGQKAKDAGFTSYVHGATYDAYNPKYRIVLPSGTKNGIECAKFAYAFFDDIFGSDVPIREVTDPADVRPGDLIQLPGHWAIVTMAAFDYEGKGPHTQTIDGGASGSIGWSTDGYVNLSAAKNIYTKYPD